jgi:HlyD family secretion protein
MTTPSYKLLPGGKPTEKSATKKSADVSWLRIAIAGYILIFLTFGVLGVWAAVAKIDRAVAAPGVVSIETNSKTVEHYEGGMVREILVKEGQAVENGAVLFRLENIQAKANFETVQHDLDDDLAVEARLEAERDQKPEITWPPELLQHPDDVSAKQVINDETAEFNKRESSLKGQIDVMESRITQLGDEIHGTELEKESAEGQIDFLKKELIGLRELDEKKLIPVTRLYAMEREQERLQGVFGESIAKMAKSNSEIGEYKIQIQQLQEKFQEDVAKSMVDVSDKIGELREKLAVTNDILRRVDVLAPVSGTAQNLKVFTIGQVVKAGEPLVDIVPRNERLIVEVQISPTDIDGVYAGQEAEVRFAAFHSRLIPLIVGHLDSVSRDRLIDDTTRQPYYRGIVSLDETQIPQELRPRVRAGMPAEVLVASGERTVLSYVVQPLVSTLRKGFID